MPYDSIQISDENKRSGKRRKVKEEREGKEKKGKERKVWFFQSCMFDICMYVVVRSHCRCTKYICVYVLIEVTIFTNLCVKRTQPRPKMKEL